MREIESNEFMARLNVASDLDTFLIGCTRADATQVLLDEFSSQSSRSEVFRRTVELSEIRFDDAYRNPWDTALAVYVWLLDRANDPDATIAAERVAAIPQCWWASKVARNVLARPEVIALDGNDEGVSTRGSSDEWYRFNPRFKRRCLPAETVRELSIA